MNQTPSSDQLEILRQFTPFQDLPDHRLEEAARHAQWLEAERREVLMELGDTEDASLFLVKGNLVLEAADGRQRVIKHTDSAARSPLSRLRPSRYRVTALTPVRYFKIDNPLLDNLLSEEEASEMLSSHYVVEESGVGGGEADFSTQVMAQIYEDLHHNRLVLYSWQPAALGITRLALREKNSPAALQPLVMLDSALTIKMLRRGTAPGAQELEERLGEALNRMGLNDVHRLIFFNLFRESCNPRTGHLNDDFRNAWEQSIAISRLSAALAKAHGLTPLDTVLTAGLLADIGKLTLLSYAYNFYREVEHDELKEAVHLLGRETGRMVLSHWKLPEYMVRGILDSYNWSQDHGGSAPTLGDLIITARLYTRLVRKGKEFKPVPALRKLHLEDPHSHKGQKLQNMVIQAIAQAREVLGLIRRAQIPTVEADAEQAPLREEA